MARPHSPKITIIPAVLKILKSIISCGTSERRHSERSEMLLLISEGGSNQKISKDYGKNYKTIKKWRHRYLASQDIFDKILLQEDKPMKKKQKELKELKEAVYSMLGDAARSGAPMTYTAIQYCQLLSLSTQTPSDYNRPINDWTPRELRDEVIKQGIFGMFHMP